MPAVLALNTLAAVDAPEHDVPTDFGPSNQLEKVWTAQGKTAGTSISVGGRTNESNADTVEVTPGYDDTWGTTVEAETVRDGLLAFQQLFGL